MVEKASSKPKTGLIVGIAAAAVVIVGCIVGLALSKKQDNNPPEKDSIVGTYELTATIDSDGQETTELVDMLKEEGETSVLVLREDKTGAMNLMGDIIDFTYDDNTFSAGEEKFAYSCEGEKLTMTYEGESFVFTRTSKQPSKIKGSIETIDLTSAEYAGTDENKLLDLFATDDEEAKTRFKIFGMVDTVNFDGETAYYIYPVFDKTAADKISYNEAANMVTGGEMILPEDISASNTPENYDLVELTGVWKANPNAEDSYSGYPFSLFVEEIKVVGKAEH